ncbi:MAG: APC family permease, partial [Anaerolineae bacterium]
ILGSFVAPHWLAQGYLYRVAGWEVYAGEAILSSLAIVLFGYLNLRGTKIVGQAQLAMVLLLVAAVGVMFAGTFLKPGVAFDNWRPLFAPEKTPPAAVLAILAIAPWAYVGFDTIPQAAEEFNFSAGKAFGLIALAIFFGAAAYITVTLATAVVFPWQELLAQRPVWATGIAIQAATGAAGVGVLVAGVTMAILTGINGFYLATSRLLFSMARVKVLPAWFARLHPVYNTPANAILFVGLLSLVAPWLGRGVILWVVDMSAVGVAIGYGYTALAAFRLSNGRPGERRWVHLLGAMFAASFLALLLIPGMPAFMAPPSWMAFAGWLALGAIFYAVQAGEYRSLPEARFEALIMGSAPAQSGD